MTHHILIASEQLWPNLLGLAALKQRDGGIASLHILHSFDRIRSENPAKRIQAIAERMIPGLAIERHATGSTSQEVFASVHQIIGSKSAERWSLNCSGGTKTMFAGLVPYARRDEVEAFYREVSTDWYFLRPRDVSGVQTFTCEHWPDANNACVDIPVNELAQVQMEIPEKAEWRCKPPPTLPLEQLAARGIATGWNWRTLQTEFPSLHQQGAGLAFEDFLSALVKAAGATNTVKSLELWEGGKPRHEFDVIVSNGQKIVIFDLKLTSEVDDPIIDQFSRLAEDRRSLGGLGADAIAVRPTWSENPIATALANAHHVALWTQNEMGNLVERITDVLRLPRLSPNNPAFGVSKQLRQAASEQKRLFSSSFSARNPMSDSPVEVSIGWLSLDKYFLECFTLAKRMVVLDMNGRFVIRGLCPESGWRTQADLASFLGDLGKVELFKVALSGGSFFAVVVPLSGNVASVREKLKQMQSPRAHL